MQQIRSEEPVKNTIHNLIQTLSVKLDSAARYGLYQEDAAKDDMGECADLFTVSKHRSGRWLQSSWLIFVSG